MIEFSDGETLDIDGKLRIEKGDDGFYVVGDGVFMQFDTEEDAKVYLYDIESSNIFSYWKLFRSPKRRRLVRKAQNKSETDLL